jgi:lysophospholipase L1-like esterase
MNRMKKQAPGVCLVIGLIALVGLGVARSSEAKKSQWVAGWGFSPQGLAPATTIVTNETVRMIARPTISGGFVRVRIENTFATIPLVIGAASIAYRNNGAQLVPGSSRPLTFSGSRSVTIPPGEGVYTDGVPFVARAWEDVAVSLYVPGNETGQVSRHGNARTTSYATAPGAGDHTADEASTAFTTTTVEMYWVAAIDVFSEADGAVVFLGDSITDGTGTTVDGHDRWHDVAYLRTLLDSNDAPNRAFVNEGIGGNRVTVTATQGSPAAVQRLDRDVLARSGISHVVFFEGTNDINSDLVNGDQLIAGMTEIIQRVKARHLKIIGATIIPRSSTTWTPQKTVYRRQVNDWIRKQAKFDGVYDFDRVILDPTSPDRMNPIYDLGDGTHPNPFGYLLLGRSMNLGLLGISGGNNGNGGGGGNDN